MLEKGQGCEYEVAESHELHQRKAANVDIDEEVITSATWHERRRNWRRGGPTKMILGGNQHVEFFELKNRASYQKYVIILVEMTALPQQYKTIYGIAKFLTRNVYYHHISILSMLKLNLCTLMLKKTRVDMSTLEPLHVEVKSNTLLLG